MASSAAMGSGQWAGWLSIHTVLRLGGIVKRWPFEISAAGDGFTPKPNITGAKTQRQKEAMPAIRRHGVKKTKKNPKHSTKIIGL
jgi:hypothetical protein